MLLPGSLPSLNQSIWTAGSDSGLTPPAAQSLLRSTLPSVLDAPHTRCGKPSPRQVLRSAPLCGSAHVPGTGPGSADKARPGNFSLPGQEARPWLCRILTFTQRKLPYQQEVIGGPLTGSIIFVAAALAPLAACCGSWDSAASPAESEGTADKHPWHTNIVATTFWVGENHDPDASDGSRALFAYDGSWLQGYGGCDGGKLTRPSAT